MPYRSSEKDLPILVLLVLLLIAACDRREASPPHTKWQVEIVDPTSGVVHVRGEFPRIEELSSLELHFRDLKRHPRSLRSFTARSGGRELAVDRITQKNGVTHRINVSGVKDPVVIDYTIDPTFFPPGGSEERLSDARSRVTGGIAVVRTTSLLPTLTRDYTEARVSFSLPADWIAVTPWRSDSAGVFTIPASDFGHVDYLGLGPFNTLELPMGEDVVRIGIPPKGTEIDVDAVSTLLKFHLEVAGGPPAGRGPRAVILVPPGFMRGGAAGARSAVQLADAMVLAHELLHWWTHSDLTKSEATWFREGFTNYYGILAAREAGLLSHDEAEECLADLNAEMRYLERDRPSSLQQASEDYSRDVESKRLVYSKGTLFAVQLERELRSKNRSLSEFMRSVLVESRAGLSNEDLRETLKSVYGHPFDKRFAAYVILGEALPDLGLPPATGRSGCARFLPEPRD